MHLSPEINSTDTALRCNTVFEYSQYPGIANCATKMLNGYQCGENIELTDGHLDVVKAVLNHLNFVGLTERLSDSVCLLAWMYGGDPSAKHFRSARQGNYVKVTMEEALNTDELRQFLYSERYDLQLYQHAVNLFNERYLITECPRRAAT